MGVARAADLLAPAELGGERRLGEIGVYHRAAGAAAGLVIGDGEADLALIQQL